MLPAKTPDVTPVQILAAVFAVFAAFGAVIDPARQAALIQLATVLVPVVVAADALIRHGRSRAVAQLASLDLRQQALEASPRIDPETGRLRSDQEDGETGTASPASPIPKPKR